jgi:citronellol/citronellal dehydrogenase
MTGVAALGSARSLSGYFDYACARMSGENPPQNFPFASDLFAGRHALVTGGGTGLGRAVATMLARAGASVVIAARKFDRLEVAAREIAAETGGDVEPRELNIRDRDSVEGLADHIAATRDGVDVLINNAGGQFPQKARDFKPKGWNAVIDTNLNGTWNMTQVFGNQMLDGRGGSITQVIALIGRGFPGIAHTAAARAGVQELTRTLAYEWGPRVRVNCVAPGAFVTTGFEAAYESRVRESSGGRPNDRNGTVDEVATGVVFMASPAASYITGETLVVAGGAQNYGKNQALFDEQFGRE